MNFAHSQSKALYQISSSPNYTGIDLLTSSRTAIDHACACIICGYAYDQTDKKYKKKEEELYDWETILFSEKWEIALINERLLQMSEQQLQRTRNSYDARETVSTKWGTFDKETVLMCTLRTLISDENSLWHADSVIRKQGIVGEEISVWSLLFSYSLNSTRK